MNLDDVIRVPYDTRPHMSKNTGEVFNPRPNDDYVRQKYHQLNLYNCQLWGITDQARQKNLVQLAAEKCNARITDNIVNLALEFEEDIAIMHNGVLSAICFCFPSSWIPRTRLGMPLDEIHQPVGDGQYLVKASRRLTEVMSDVDLGSFRRTVWTITRTSLLSNHPDTVKIYRDIKLSLDTLNFRMETQTTCPLGDGKTSLFFVKVDVLPLSAVWFDYGERILDSINSMSPAVLEYKNLVDIKQYLNSVLPW